MNPGQFKMERRYMMVWAACEKMVLDVYLTHDSEYFTLKHTFLFNHWRELSDF